MWIQGPYYPACKFKDNAIFNKVLCKFLDLLGERVEADKGYAGHPDKIVCPTNPEPRLLTKASSGDLGAGKSASRDTERAAQDLGDPLPGLLPPHCLARDRFLGVCSDNPSRD